MKFYRHLKFGAVSDPDRSNLRVTNVVQALALVYPVVDRQAVAQWCRAEMWRALDWAVAQSEALARGEAGTMPPDHVWDAVSDGIDESKEAA